MESDDKREQGDEKGTMVTSGLEIKNEWEWYKNTAIANLNDLWL